MKSTPDKIYLHQLPIASEKIIWRQSRTAPEDAEYRRVPEEGFLFGYTQNDKERIQVVIDKAVEKVVTKAVEKIIENLTVFVGEPKQPKKLSLDDVLHTTFRPSVEINTNPWELRCFRPDTVCYHTVRFKSAERFRYAQEHLYETKALFKLEMHHHLNFDREYLTMDYQREYHA